MIQDLLHGWHELETAYPDYREAEVYYDGKPDETFADARVAALVARQGKRYRFNFAKTPVNVLASRVQLAAITVPGSEQLTETLTSVLDANDMEIHFPDVIRKAFEYGDAYLMAWPLEPDDASTEAPGSVADQELVSAGIEITVHSPLHTRMIYDTENERRKAYQIRRWCVRGLNPNEKIWRVDLYYPTIVERWVSIQGADLTQQSGWTEYVDEDQPLWEIENPWGEVPWFHLRTDLPYGTPVHAAGYGCQDAINKLLITLLLDTENLGWPQRFALVDPAAELDSNSDGPDWTSDDRADDTSAVSGGESSNIRTGPGTVAVMAGMKEVGQWDAANPDGFMSPAKDFIRMMSQITETPFHAFDPGGDIPSGESLRVADAPLVKRTEMFTTMFRSPLTELAQLLLKMAGTRPAPVEIRWKAAQSATGLDDWQIISAKQSAGVPIDQTLVEAGYDSEQVARWLDEQGEAMDLGHRVDLLGKIGLAVQSIGAGVALGVVSDADAASIISMVLKQATAPSPDPA